MKNAVIYARYSSDRQREESIEGQIRVCEDFARRNDMRILKIYTDRALTGRTDKRPEFQLMIKEAASRAFEVVIVYKLNRFARNRYDSASYKHKLKKYGVKVVSAMENIADDPSGILLESVIEGMAEYYSAELSENVIRGQTENILEGKWAGGTVPLGYKLNKEKRLILDEEKVPIVKLIFSMAAEGYGTTAIVRELNRRGYLNSRGKKFSASNVYVILKNKHYMGKFYWRGVESPVAIPIIIAPSDFEAVQKVMNTRKVSRVKTSEKYMLSGKLFCGECGARMLGVSGTSKNGIIYHYYACPNHRHKNTRTCERTQIRADIIDSTVCDVTTRLLESDAAVEAIARQAVEVQTHTDVNAAIAATKKRMADVKKKIDNCVKAVESGIISDAIAKTLRDNEETLRDLECELAKQEIARKSSELTVDKIRFFFKSICRDAKKADKYRRILLSTLVRMVIVRGDALEIRYNYANEYPDLQNPVKAECSYNNRLVVSCDKSTNTIYLTPSYFYVLARL